MIPGEVGLVWFPFSKAEPQPYKQRPVLIVAATGTSPDQAVLVAMITGNARRVRSPGPGDVPIDDWKGSGLQKPSVVRTRRIWTAEERDFTGAVLGTVEADVLDHVRRLLRQMVG